MPELTPGSLAVVTGGTGFIGRALCAVLREHGLRVRVLARRHAEGPWDECVVADLAVGALAPGAFAGAAAVFHLAGKAHALAERAGEEGEYEAVNVGGTQAALAAARAAGAGTFVLASSVKAMGEGGAVALDEDAPAAPATPYGRSKLAAERLVLAAHEGGLHTAVLRLPLVYGPGMKGNLARMLAAVARGWWPSLALPANARSMVDVRDVAVALWSCATVDAARGRVYLVTDGEDYSSARVAGAMRAALGVRAPRLRVPWLALRLAAATGDLAGRALGRRMPLDTHALHALSSSARYDGSRIRRELGFAPAWTLERALPGLVAPEMVAKARGAQEGV